MLGAETTAGKKIILLQVLFVAAVLLGFARDSYFLLFAVLEALVFCVFAATALSMGRELGGDFSKTVFFFFGLMVLLELFFFIPPALPQNQGAWASIILLFSLPVFFIAFRAVFSRNFCFAAVVSSDGSECVVKTDFDLLSFGPPRTVSVPCSKMFRKGERVKLGFRRTFFGIKPGKVL